MTTKDIIGRLTAVMVIDSHGFALGLDPEAPLAAVGPGTRLLFHVVSTLRQNAAGHRFSRLRQLTLACQRGRVAIMPAPHGLMMLARISHQPSVAASQSTASSRPSPSAHPRQPSRLPSADFGPRSSNHLHFSLPHDDVGENSGLAAVRTNVAIRQLRPVLQRLQDDIEQRIGATGDTVLAGLPDDTVAAVLSAMDRALLDGGADPDLLSEDRRRRCILDRLRRISLGRPERDDLRDLNVLLQQLDAGSVLRVLGAGCWGAVYELHSGEALKVTRDLREAQVSAALVGRPLEYLPRFQQVVRLKVLGRPTPYALVVRQKVRRAGALDRQQYALFDLARYLWVRPRLFDAEPKSQADALRAYAGEAQRELVDEALRQANMLWDELRENQINFGDFHSGNFGIRHGHLCLFDVGLGLGPPVKVPWLDATGPFDHRRTTPQGEERGKSGRPDATLCCGIR